MLTALNARPSALTLPDGVPRVNAVGESVCKGPRVRDAPAQTNGPPERAVRQI